MCEMHRHDATHRMGYKTIPLADAVGVVLAHDITEIRRGEFKGRAFRKGHVVREDDICHLQRLGKENLYVLEIPKDTLHEDEAVEALTAALMGEGVKTSGRPKEGKINILADRTGLLRVNEEALLRFNMLGEVMCATRHNNTPVKKGEVIAGTRAIPLIIKRALVEEAATIGRESGGVIEVKKLRKPRVGVVITGNEVFHGRIQDAFGPIIVEKLDAFEGEIVGLRYAPDNESIIAGHLKELLNAGADLLITTGGMSVDPDDVTRFAIRSLGATDISYGSAVLPGAMFLVAYLRRGNGDGVARAGNPVSPAGSVPILGIPACGMYAHATVFDLVLPRVLAGDFIGRKELAALGHGGLCTKCGECRFPKCSFGK
ncbi:MAG: molybdopterin-binding protein [Syntrophobacteraceae bacterium]